MKKMKNKIPKIRAPTSPMGKERGYPLREIAFKKGLLNANNKVFYSKLHVGQKNDLSQKNLKTVPGFQKIFL